MRIESTQISSGIDELDSILNGLLIGDNVIWYDDAGSLAWVFTINFLKVTENLKKPFIYVSFDRSPRNLLEKLKSLGEYEKLTILDCFTHGKGKGEDIFLSFYDDLYKDWPCSIIKVNNPQDQEKVMNAFLEVHSGMKEDLRFVFESLTGMQELWEGENQISRFYSHTCPRLYELNTIGYWIVEKDAHSKKLKAIINQIAQVAIELSLKRGKTSLSVIKAENREVDELNTPRCYATKNNEITFDAKKISSGHIDLGKRLKDFRTRRKMSQTDLARLIGVTPSSISQIENNQIYPSLPALFKISESLSIEVGSFFQKTSDLKNRIVFSESEGVEVHTPNIPKDCISIRLIAPVDADSVAELYLIEIYPQKELSTHFFNHKGEEFGYVLTGKLEMTIEGQSNTIRTGDTIHLTEKVPSKWSNSGQNVTRLLWIKLK